MGLVDHEKFLLYMTTGQIWMCGQIELEPKVQYQKHLYNNLLIERETLDMDDQGMLGELVSRKDLL